MSVESITWALKQPVPTSSAKFVLFVMANQANDETGLTFPSIGYLTDATAQDRKTVISNLAKLVQWGLIEDTGQRVGTTRQIVVYRLVKGDDLFSEQSQNRKAPKNGTVPKADEGVAATLVQQCAQERNCTESGTVPDSDANSTVFPSKQSRFSAKESQKRDTEPSEPSRNHKSNHSAPAALDLSAWPSQPSQRVLIDWLAHRKAKRAPVSETVIASFGDELRRAADLDPDWTVDKCLTECMNRNWQGFKADWLRDTPPSKQRDNGASHASRPPGRTLCPAERIKANADRARRQRGELGHEPRPDDDCTLEGQAVRVPN